MVRITYDAGSEGHMYNGNQFEADSWISIGNGTGEIRRAQKTSTPLWCAGFTIPPTDVFLRVRRVGVGAANPQSPGQLMTVSIRKQSDDSIIATATINTHPSLITNVTEGEEVSASFVNITEFEPSTDYYYSIEYNYGDNTNYLELATSDQAGYTMSSYISSWIDTADTALLMDIHPGKSPKASYGKVFNKRPLIAGDPDNVGTVHVGNLSYLDWSTPGGGGDFPIWDNGRNTGEIGGMEVLFGDCFFFGVSETPYLVRLRGTSPQDYVFKEVFTKVWVPNQRTPASVANDIWFANPEGVSALSGVQQYGDIRTFKESDKIDDKIAPMVGADMRAAYDADSGLYIVFERGSTIAYGAHVKLPIPNDHGQITYPWTRFTGPIEFSAIGFWKSDTMVGGMDGNIYQLNDFNYQDLGEDMELSLTLPYKEFVFRTRDMTEIQFQVRSDLGGTFLCSIYRDGLLAEPHIQFTYTLALSDVAIVDEMTMDVDNANFAVDQEATVPWSDLNFEARSFQVKLDNFILNGAPIFINGILFKAKGLSD